MQTELVGLESGVDPGAFSIFILSIYRLHHPMPHIWNKTETSEVLCNLIAIKG